jgi:hypothetical protein
VFYETHGIFLDVLTLFSPQPDETFWGTFKEQMKGVLGKVSQHQENVLYKRSIITPTTGQFLCCENICLDLMNALGRFTQPIFGLLGGSKGCAFNPGG